VMHQFESNALINACGVGVTGCFLEATFEKK